MDRTSERLAQCYTGITCSATVSQSSATTHMYAAYVAYSVLVNGFEEEPDGSVQTAGFVYATWADTGWTVSLSAGPFSGGDQTFIATASADVAPTPYYIEIFSVYQNKQIGLCSSGSTCTAIHTSQFRDDDVQAFVTTITSSVFPLPDSVSVQASSNVVNPLTD